MNNDADSRIALNALGWEPLNVEIKKCVNNIGPKLLSSLFSCKNKNTHCELRYILNALVLPKPNTNGMKKSFVLYASLAWNLIPRGY